MKRNLFVAVALILLSKSSFASSLQYFQGSDTMAGMITDAIIASGMDKEISYEGGGSGLGEKALLNGQQGIAPMSRPASEEALKKAAELHLELIPHVLAFDGLGIFVHASNQLVGTDLDTLRKIYTCKLTRWEEIHGSPLRGEMKVYRRNDVSGTTDTFKNLVGIKEFGSCVTVLAETVDIATKTGQEPLALGYSGATAKRENNRALKLAKVEGGDYIELTANNVRTFAYPLSRKLFVYEVGGARSPSETEKKLLNDYLLDRSFLDPIVQDHEFYTQD